MLTKLLRSLGKTPPQKNVYPLIVTDPSLIMDKIIGAENFFVGREGHLYKGKIVQYNNEQRGFLVQLDDYMIPLKRRDMLYFMLFLNRETISGTTGVMHITNKEILLSEPRSITVEQDPRIAFRTPISDHTGVSLAVSRISGTAFRGERVVNIGEGGCAFTLLKKPATFDHVVTTIKYNPSKPIEFTMEGNLVRVSHEEREGRYLFGVKFYKTKKNNRLLSSFLRYIRQVQYTESQTNHANTLPEAPCYSTIS